MHSVVVAGPSTPGAFRLAEV